MLGDCTSRIPSTSAMLVGDARRRSSVLPNKSYRLYSCQGLGKQNKFKNVSPEFDRTISNIWYIEKSDNSSWTAPRLPLLKIVSCRAKMRKNRFFGNLNLKFLKPVSKSILEQWKTWCYSARIIRFYDISNVRNGPFKFWGNILAFLADSPISHQTTQVFRM